MPRGIVKIWRNAGVFEINMYVIAAVIAVCGFELIFFCRFLDTLLNYLMINVGLPWIFLFITWIVSGKMTQNWKTGH